MDQLIELFCNPPPENTPGYFWIMKERMNAEVLKVQLHDMYDHGARSVCLHPYPPQFRPADRSRMSPEYLSDEYFAVIAEIVKECEKLGMNYYLYDEGGWPSGGACGQVLRNNPELVMQQLVPDENGHAAVKLLPGDPAEESPHPDILRRETAAEFIRLTHESHRKFVGKYFGKTIRFTFDDEPAFCSSGIHKLTWSPALPEEFLRRKGYRLEPWLDRLLSGIPPSEQLTEVRIDFHEVCTQLYIENFLLPLRKWCRKNGLLSGGHLGGEDQPELSARHGYGSAMKALRAFDLPGVDVIWQQLYPGRREHSFPKFASSVANQHGSPYCLAELFAIYGAGLTPEVMRWLLNYMFLHGCNLLIFSSYVWKASGKEMSGGRPKFGPCDPLWKYFDLLHGYAGRISALLSQGQANHPTALLFDIRSLWADNEETGAADQWRERTALRLFQRQCGFDYIDEDMLAESTMDHGEFVAGAMRYRELVIPETRRLTPEAETFIARFQAAGGLVTTNADDAAPLLEVTPATAALRVESRRSNDGRMVWFCFNSGTAEIAPLLRFPGAAFTADFDAETGRIAEIPMQDGRITCRLGPYEARLFVTSTSPFYVTERVREFVEQSRITIRGRWQLQALTRYRAGKEELEIVPAEHCIFTVEPGDWRPILGEDFSGDAVYTTDFEYSGDGEVCILDLGRVNYACSVELNGAFLGRRLWGPYRFDLAAHLRRGTNTLRVTVTNLMANLLAPREIEERLERDFPPRSCYEERVRIFERTSLASGLFGPVTIEQGFYR